MQGALGVIIENLNLILGWCVVDSSVKALVVALVWQCLAANLTACRSSGVMREWALFEIGYVPSTGKYKMSAEHPERADLNTRPKNGCD